MYRVILICLCFVGCTSIEQRFSNSSEYKTAISLAPLKYPKNSNFLAKSDRYKIPKVMKQSQTFLVDQEPPGYNN